MILFYIFLQIVGCQINNIPILHGSSHRPRRCVECSCDNGRISCTRQDPNHDCPKLNCPTSDQIQEEGECCKVCKGKNTKLKEFALLHYLLGFQRLFNLFSIYL